MSSIKVDSQCIIDYVDNLKKSSWLGSSRSWWPDFVYHFTDVHNAVKILDTNQLLSRGVLETLGHMAIDNASPDVIYNTDNRWKEYVRLYFRPRTPTQYNNEGFRPINQLKLGGAHCPIPVYLFFDSKSVLCRENASFSEGSLAAQGHVNVYYNCEGLNKIPFNLVYHDGPMYPEEKSKIKFHRHAEVIVPREMNLSALRYIWCRSNAEYETLMNLLGNNSRKWAGRVGVGTKLNLFFREWTFIEEANLMNDTIIFKFNPTTRAPGPFTAKVEIYEKATNITYTWVDENYFANDKLNLSLTNLKCPNDYKVKLFFNDNLAYYGNHKEDSILF